MSNIDYVTKITISRFLIHFNVWPRNNNYDKNLLMYKITKKSTFAVAT